MIQSVYNDGTMKAGYITMSASAQPHELYDKSHIWTVPTSCDFPFPLNVRFEGGRLSESKLSCGELTLERRASY